MEDFFIFAIVAVAVAGWAWVASAKSLSKQKTRRELLAYVAEGTISPEDAARLIQLDEDSEMRKKVLAQAGWEWDQKAYRATLDRVFNNAGVDAPEQPSTAGPNPPLSPQREAPA